MDEEDYFGEITIPFDEEEEDAANDLTFGDTSDIKAGDEASDAAWKPNHQTLSSKIEAEKEALQRSRLSAEDFSVQSDPLNLRHSHQNEQPIAQQSAPLAQDSSAWELLKQLQQPTIQPFQRPIQSPLRHAAQQQTQQHAQQPVPQALQLALHESMSAHMGQSAIQQTVHPHLHPQIHMQHQISQYSHQQTPVLLDARAQEYQRALVAHQEQKTRLLLQQHVERAEQQLREAERAQQAGITFDREEFNRHQEATRQRILSDHYTRVRQIQYHVWQANEQLRQATERSIGPLPGLDLSRRADSVSVPSPALAQGPVESANLNHFVSHLSANSLASVRAGNAANGFYHSEVPWPSEVAKSRVSTLTDEELEKAPRMLEIERQMAAAGLGPKAEKGKGQKDGFRSPSRGILYTAEKDKPKKAARLESMTDRDLELVFRAHLRQIESSVLYRDDYYNTILKSREKNSEQMLFPELAEEVQALLLREKSRAAQGYPVRTRNMKRNSKSSTTEDQFISSSPSHSDQNMRALANALGTVQSWNPRAPRRVMEFGLLEKREPLEDGQKSLGEDERVRVRLEVERGYDIIATIHDIVRGESQQSLIAPVKSLLSTLHLAERSRRDGEGERNRLQSTHFFATMCAIEKGRGYLAKVLEILEVPERMQVISAIFENLGLLVFASKKCDDNNGSAGVQGDLFFVMTKTIQNPDTTVLDCLHFFNSFTTSHVQHHDAFLTTLRSIAGSRLLFLCMQRMSAGLSKQKAGEQDCLMASVDDFIQAFTVSLKEIFDGAESVGRVWEVAASLDALATGKSRSVYRMELNKLLRSGALPPPPSTPA